MCRIFGFRSVIQSQVHQSLVSAENALELQSEAHPDGWGVAYYVAGSPHLVKSSEAAALHDNLFKKVSGVVSSETVVAHIRKSTQGVNNILNTHPFQFGRWVFAHNGHIPKFEKYKNELLGMVQPKFRRFVLGETDSEILFYLLLSELNGLVDIEKRGVKIEVLAQAVASGIEKIQKITGPMSEEDVEGDLSRVYLTFVLTDGETMIGHQGGKELFFSTYKSRCGDRETCPSFAPECEAKTVTGNVNHLIFSSEPLSGENIWLGMRSGQMIGVDRNMKLNVFDRQGIRESN